MWDLLLQISLLTARRVAGSSARERFFFWWLKISSFWDKNYRASTTRNIQCKRILRNVQISYDSSDVGFTQTVRMPSYGRGVYNFYSGWKKLSL